VEITLQDLVVDFADFFDELFAVGVRFDLELFGNLFDDVIGAERFVFPPDRLHSDDVDDARKVVFAADGDLNRDGIALKLRADLIEGAGKVGPDAVHLVDETDARDAVLVRLPPHGFRLRLDAGDRVEHGDGAVEDAERPLDLGGEVHMAGGVDDVDAMVAPHAGRRRRRNGDAALLLLLHPVHHGRTFMHLTDLVGDAGIEQDALGRRRLAGIDVGHDADVAAAIE
jgi:hypothetical protein